MGVGALVRGLVLLKEAVPSVSGHFLPCFQRNVSTNIIRFLQFAFYVWEFNQVQLFLLDFSIFLYQVSEIVQLRQTRLLE